MVLRAGSVPDMETQFKTLVEQQSIFENNHATLSRLFLVRSAAIDFHPPPRMTFGAMFPDTSPINNTAKLALFRKALKEKMTLLDHLELYNACHWLNLSLTCCTGSYESSSRHQSDRYILDGDTKAIPKQRLSGIICRCFYLEGLALREYHENSP